jgi:predicted ABC-type ATPase
MKLPTPTCYIIAGPNGAGKTTFATEFLPVSVACFEFVNPDMIAKGLSPFDPTLAASRAGRLVLERITELADHGKEFGFETTLAGRTYLTILNRLKRSGYALHMFYVWIPHPDLALSRIAHRVRHGGHDVSEIDVRRRFPRTFRNLAIYRPLLDSLFVFDNSGEHPVLAWEEDHGRRTIHDAVRSASITREMER